MNIPHEHLPGLMLFARVAQYGSLSAAAKSLNSSRSAVSKQLANFEAQIGARLIQRTTRKLALTELGEQILREAEQVQQALNAIESITDDFRQEIRGKLKVSCSTSLGRVRLLPLLSVFAEQYPDIEMELGLEDRFVDLVAEQIDVSIRIGHLPDSTIIARRLGELSWQLAASPAYVAQYGEPKTPADLANHACLFYRNNRQVMNRWTFTKDAQEHHVQVSGPLAINDACALVDACINNMGILLVDHAIMSDGLASGKLIPLLKDYQPAPGLPVYAVYPARNFLPAKTSAFVEFLKTHLSPQLM